VVHVDTLQNLGTEISCMCTELQLSAMQDGSLNNSEFCSEGKHLLGSSAHMHKHKIGIRSLKMKILGYWVQLDGGTGDTCQQNL
jgi:hypothetical protein